MTRKVRPNDRCPCGSGKKYKRCCALVSTPGAQYTQHDRRDGLTALAAYARGSAEDEALFWGGRRQELLGVNEVAVQILDQVRDFWVWADRPGDDGRVAVDALLASPHGLGRGPQAWLRALKPTSQRLYDVVEAVPGQSLRLREVLGEAEVTVIEGAASRSLEAGTLLSARVIPVGLTGKPELELGMMAYPAWMRDDVVQTLRATLERLADAHPELSALQRHKQAAPVLARAWLGGFAPRT